MSHSESSFQSQRRQRLILAAALAVLGAGAASYGLASTPALAEPAPASPPGVTTSATSQSAHARAASADTDFGPGQCEPCVAGVE